MRLVDDDEFQEDMRDATVRRAVDEVVADFRAVERWRNARAMRVLDAFRRVQRFCKERGRKIAFADVLVANEREAEAKRAELRRLRRGVELALRRAEEAAAGGAEEGTRRRHRDIPGTRDIGNDIDFEFESGRHRARRGRGRSGGGTFRGGAAAARARAATRAAVFAVSLFVTVYVFGFRFPGSISGFLPATRGKPSRESCRANERLDRLAEE